MIQDAEKINKNIRRACRKEILQELEEFSKDDLNRITYTSDVMLGSEQPFDQREGSLNRIKSLLGVLRSVRPLRYHQAPGIKENHEEF